MAFKAKITADGNRNASVEVTGFLLPQGKSDKLSIFKLCKFEHTSLKLTQITFLIQEKAGLYLWWDEEGDDLILPLESRGGFKFDGKKADKLWDGQIWASAFKLDEPKGFVLIMDFDK